MTTTNKATRREFTSYDAACACAEELRQQNPGCEYRVKSAAGSGACCGGSKMLVLKRVDGHWTAWFSEAR